MNWGALSVVVGLIGLAVYTMPWGIIILAGMYWVYTRG
jgi:hypothetical protein